MRTDGIAAMAGPGNIRTSAEVITLAGARMERQISDLLDVACIQSGTLRIIKRRHDIGALLFELLRSYESMFSARNITLTVNTPADTIEALFDYDRIVQVLSNLLGNAMKFTQGGGSVTLHVERQQEAVAFELSDNGPGIPPSKLPHVFERFCQIDSEDRRGLGLGLHICDNIVQAHGGQICAESEVGKGATFRFTLPVQ